MSDFLKIYVNASLDMPFFPYLMNDDGLIFEREGTTMAELSFRYHVVCLEAPETQVWQSIGFCNGNEVIYCIQ